MENQKHNNNTKTVSYTPREMGGQRTQKKIEQFFTQSASRLNLPKSKELAAPKSICDMPNPLEDIKVKLAIKESPDEGNTKIGEEPKNSLGFQISQQQKPANQVLGFQTVVNDSSKRQGSPLLNAFVTKLDSPNKNYEIKSPITKSIPKQTQSK